MLENLFKLKENHTSVKTEVIAGITTFMTMAYILAVNPSVLSAAGMDPTAVLLATCIASFIGTFMYGTYCEPSIRTFRWYGIKCLSCLYRCWCDGLSLAGCFTCCIH